MLGGLPARKEPLQKWPIFGSREEEELLKALRSGHWGRGSGAAIKNFEESFARTMQTRHCLATSSGTGSLVTALAAVGVEAGDEVILTPYTFVACANAILVRNALPVFVDVDRETFQLDVSKVEAAITDRTTAILPVHIGGSPVDINALIPLAGKHGIPILEDVCQAHFAEWRGRKLGTLTQAGCFSFQSSKHLNSGEGGAILMNDDQLYERCYAFHYNGMRPTKIRNSGAEVTAACKFMLTEFQAAVLFGQLSRLEEQAARRNENATYLTKQMSDIPGILPARLQAGCTRSAYHLYMFRYRPEHFENLPRATFLKALVAEGIPASAGYSPLNTQPFIKSTLQSRGFERIVFPIPPCAVVVSGDDQVKCRHNK